MEQQHLICIRDFEPRDRRAAAEVITAAARKAYANLNWNETVADMEQWLDAEKAGWSHQFVLEAAGNVTGFMALQDKYVDQLFRAPAWQGQGLGARLLARAKAVYPHQLTLSCAQLNWKACRFYERQGWVAQSVAWHGKHHVSLIIYRRVG
jgi:GNAT superfamily N-acetyltransferase